MFWNFTGDFAVLLKAGMTIKQALICNLISSVLCLFGVLIGLTIGTSYDIAPWIFACTAGMFLYIALVDMVILASTIYFLQEHLQI